MHRTFVVGLVCLLATVSARADEVMLLNPPCRLLDTRNTSVGFLASNVTLAIRARQSSSPGGQGGPSGCSIPDKAEGAVVNLVAIQPAASGHAILWAAGTAMPGAAALSFSAAENVSDGILVPLSAFGSGDDMFLRASAGAFWVLDLIGWIGKQDTAMAMGEVLNKQNLTAPTVGHQLTLDGTARDLVCKAPWIDPAACDQFDVGDCIAVTGHIAPSFSLNHLYVHTITACP